MPPGGIIPGLDLADGLLPGRGVRAGMNYVQSVQHQTTGLRFLVMASDAVRSSNAWSGVGTAGERSASDSPNAAAMQPPSIAFLMAQVNL